MKREKRFAIIGGAAFVIMILAGLGIAGASFHHCRGFHGDMPDFMLKRLDSKMAELNLTPAQQAEYDRLRAQLKANLLAMKEGRKELRETVRGELAKESPDVAALTAAMKKKIDALSGTLQNDLDLLASFYSTLDENQKHKVLAGISKRMAAMDGCREEKK